MAAEFAVETDLLRICAEKDSVRSREGGEVKGVLRAAADGTSIVPPAWPGRGIPTGDPDAEVGAGEPPHPDGVTRCDRSGHLPLRDVFVAFSGADDQERFVTPEVRSGAEHEPVVQPD